MGIISDIKQNAEEIWDTASEGWRSLREQGWGGITHFYRSDGHKESSKSVPIAIESHRLVANWSVLAGDVVEHKDKIVVRLEVPGMKKEDFDIQVLDDNLIVHGEKQCEVESTQGKYRLMECAYGIFNRTLRLPSPVMVEKSTARYDCGVLKITLPKVKAASHGQFQVNIQ